MAIWLLAPLGLGSARTARRRTPATVEIGELAERLSSRRGSGNTLSSGKITHLHRLSSAAKQCEHRLDDNLDYPDHDQSLAEVPFQVYGGEFLAIRQISKWAHFTVMLARPSSMLLVQNLRLARETHQ